MFSLLDRNPLTSVVFINVALGFNHIEKRQSYGEYSALMFRQNEPVTSEYE